MVNISSSCLFEKITLESAAKYAPEAFLQPKKIQIKKVLIFTRSIFYIISPFTLQTSSLRFRRNLTKAGKFLSLQNDERLVYYLGHLTRL